MEKHPLHIVNGGNLASYLQELQIVGEKLAWQELLCEGPTQRIIHCDDFIELRRSFLNEFYNVELDLDRVKFALVDQLSNTERYSEIVLWFDYDLFSHMNMIAVINLLQQKKIELPIYLVCSGRVKGSKVLTGLMELTSGQLLSHYKNKIRLNSEDIDMATTIWGIYGGKDHNLLKPFIVKSSSFKYLNNCLKAHLERFPDSKSGLNILETNILTLIKKHNIKSKHHLLGYALYYQGYYGYHTLQLERIIDMLSPFYKIEDNGQVRLNRKGHEAFLGRKNFACEIKNNMVFGGVKKMDFQFSKSENKLVKTPLHVD